MSQSPCTVAFLHIGPDVQQPALMVASIRRHNPSAQVIQLSDEASPAVPGVDQVGRGPVNVGELMVARMQLFSVVAIAGPTWFLDTDMLCHAPLEFDAAEPFDAAICERGLRRDYFFNPSGHTETFNELAGLRMGEVFPYLACTTLVRRPDFWGACLSVVQSLPLKYRRWYGDQVALRQVSIAPQLRLARLPEATYACLPGYEDEAAPPILTHYKGSKRKGLMAERAAAEGY